MTPGKKSLLIGLPLVVAIGVFIAIRAEHKREAGCPLIKSGMEEAEREEAEQECARMGIALSPLDMEGLEGEELEEYLAMQGGAAQVPIRKPLPPGALAVEQSEEGSKTAAIMVDNFEGPGLGFVGPQGAGRGSNPSDHSLAVGPNHIMAIVNGGGMHIWTKKGKLYDTTGKVLYGPVNVRNVWKGFGGQCDTRGSGDAVARYDQLADRWLIVVPLFSYNPYSPDQQPLPPRDGSVVLSRPHPGQPGPAVVLDQPPPPDPNAGRGTGAGNGAGGGGNRGARGAQDTTTRPPVPDNLDPRGTYGMCYAVSTTSDPLGSYYRYEFDRPLFPDYPRPAIWPDGYYIPTSTSDNKIEKHICVADREKMLKGLAATEQCMIIPGIPFINPVDLDGKNLPPKGAVNYVLSAGGSQLNNILADSALYAWTMHVDWVDPLKSRFIGPDTIKVAPYQFLCGGQLKNCVPQPENSTRLDSQGDKLMARVTYRRIGNTEHILAAHSVNTSLGGGVRWYELRPGKNGKLEVYQQGTYAPKTTQDTLYRWLPSMAMDKFGNIGVGYSFGGSPFHAGQRFSGREPNDPKGKLTFKENFMVEGAGSQNQSRWEDYSQTAVDPDDDCTIWYIGDYVKAGATQPSSRIASFKMPGCR